MKKIAIFALIYISFYGSVYADFDKEIKFLENKDCKNFFKENENTKKEIQQQYPDNENVKNSLLAYALGREADGHKDCNNDVKNELKLRLEGISLLESIKRPDLDILQQLATSYQLVGYNYNRLGNINNGIKFLEKGLKIDEENFYNKNYKSISVTYNVLGFWYVDIYDYKKGEEYQKKYLDYVKKNKTDTSIEFFKAYSGLGSDYIRSGRYDFALNTYLDLEKKLANFKLDIDDQILFYRDLSLTYYWLQDFNLQKKNLLIAFDILSKNKEKLDQDKFTRYEILINNDLGLSYSHNYSIVGNIENLYLAKKHYLKSIELSKVINKDDELHINFGNLAAVYSSLGDHTKAIEFHEKSLKLCQISLGKLDVSCLKQISALGHAYYSNNNYDKALSLYLFAIQNEPNDFGSFQDFRISNRNLVGLLYQTKGNYELAEKYLLEAISLWDPEKPQNYLAYFDTLNSLYNLYYSMGRLEDSGNGFKELLKLVEDKYGADSPQLITPLNGLNLYYNSKGLIDKSIKSITRAIDILEKNVSTHNLKGTLYHNLAFAHSTLGQTMLAEKNYEIALSLRKADKGFDTVMTSIQLAKEKIYLKKFSEAEVLLNESLFIVNENIGINHPLKASIYQRYLELYFLTKQIDKYIKNFSEFHQLVSSHANGTFGSQYTVKKDYFETPVNLSLDSLNLLLKDQYNFLVESFSKHSNISLENAVIELTEISRTTTINESVKNLIERSKDPKVSSLKKEYQNLIINYEKALKFSNINSEKKVIFNNLANLKNEIFEKRKLLLKSLDLNSEKIINNQISLKKIQSEIKNDEVLLAYYFTENNLYVTIINNQEVIFETLNTTNEKINNIIKNIRESLNVTQDKTLKEFNVLQSRILFNEILNPILSSIKNKKNIIIVPHKSLLSIPFELLIDEEGLEKNNDYQNIKWFINKYNISYYPSIHSFYSLRTITIEKTSKDFAGFGDPKFVHVAKSTSDIVFSNFYLRSGIANRNELMKFEELPETRNELSFLSKVFKNGSDLYLGKDFTEKKVKSLKLDQYKVISFATHAVLANEINNIGEPGIIMTPPDIADQINDGVLTVSEIQKLKLSATTVILSACNTAGKDGGANAEGLSGLASAFFQAGARSLMVTHWSVETNSAVKIMTDTFKNFENNNSLSKSLTLAKREMIKNKSTSHPMYWAPFVIVGDNPKIL